MIKIKDLHLKIVDKSFLLYNNNMNLLGKILKSSQRGRSRPWYSHRYIARMLLVIIGVFIYEYNIHTQARTFNDIIKDGTLHVGYLKAPDIAFENGHQQFGFQYDILSAFAESHSLNIKLHQVSKSTAMVGLNNNQFDILIGHFAKHSSQKEHPFSAHMPVSLLKGLLTSKDYAKEKTKFEVSSDFYDSNRTWLPYQETHIWHYSNAVIIEHKKARTPKTQKIPKSEVIYYNAGFPTKFLASSNLNLQSIDKNPLLENISKNEVYYGLTTLLRLNINQKFISKLRRVRTFKEKIPLVWLVAKKYDEEFLGAINNFINQDKTQEFIAKQGKNWWKKYLRINHLDVISIHNRIHSKLPALRPLFQSADKQENISWTLLAALAFQESKWNIDAVSPTHVRGVMQLTQATADLLGVKDRTDPTESIHAAAQYLKKLEQNIPIRVKRKDRIWLAVAAYNLGPGRIKKAYHSVHDQIKGEITWNAIANELTKRSDFFQSNQYNSGVRAVEYVERIREFQKILRYYSVD